MDHAGVPVVNGGGRVRARASLPALSFLIAGVVLGGLLIVGPQDRSGLLPTTEPPVSAGITTPLPAAGGAPSDPPLTPTPVAPPPDLLAGLDRWVWAAPGADERWWIGAAGAAPRSTDLRTDSEQLFALGERLVSVPSAGRERPVDEIDPVTGARTRLGTLQLPTSTIGVFFVEAPASTAIFANVSEAGLDGGVVVLTADGVTHQVVPPREAIGVTGRGWLASSASGATVVSTYCDFEQCDVDVIVGPEFAWRSMPEKFNVVATTDTVLLGRVPGELPSPWALRSLADGTTWRFAVDLISQLSVAVVVNDTTFVVGTTNLLENGGYLVLAIDAASGTVRQLYQSLELEGPSIELLNVRFPDPGWIVLGPRSVSDVVFRTEQGEAVTLRFIRVADGLTVDVPFRAPDPRP